MRSTTSCTTARSATQSGRKSGDSTSRSAMERRRQLHPARRPALRARQGQRPSRLGPRSGAPPSQGSRGSNRGYMPRDAPQYMAAPQGREAPPFAQPPFAQSGRGEPPYGQSSRGEPPYAQSGRGEPPYAQSSRGEPQIAAPQRRSE